MAIYWGSRSSDDRSQVLDALCKQSSSHDRRAIRIVYDTRVGRRLALLFEAGEMKARFDEQDETYLLLGDDGEPRLDSKPYAFSDLGELEKNGEEFETAVNAVQIALDSCGWGKAWPALRDVIFGSD